MKGEKMRIFKKRLTMVFTLLSLLLLINSAVLADSSFKGITINFLTNTNLHQEIIATQMEKVAKEMGMEVNTRFLTVDELKLKGIMDYIGGVSTWDIIYTGGIQQMYELWNMGAVAPIQDFINDKDLVNHDLLQLDDIAPSGLKAVTFNGQILGFVATKSEQALAYREDLFNNKIEKEAFKEKYDYELQPPETYKQFKDVAEFFTRKKGEKLCGVTLENDFYGTSFPNKKGTLLWHSYQNLIIAFGVQVYNPETGKPEFDSPANIDALRYYGSLVPFLPENHMNMGSGECVALFADGKIAMVTQYFDRIVGTVDKPDSKVKGKVKYAFPPTEVGNPLNRKHAYRSGPAVLIISSLSRNKEAAYKLLEATLSAENQYEMAQDPGYISTKMSVLQRIAKEKPVMEYLSRAEEAGIDNLTDAGILPYPSILKSAKIGDIVSDAVSAVLTGASPEKEANKAQEKLEELFSK